MKEKSDFIDDDGVFDGEKAYGAVLGTFLVCSWVEVVLAFVKPQVGVVGAMCVRQAAAGGWFRRLYVVSRCVLFRFAFFCVCSKEIEATSS